MATVMAHAFCDEQTERRVRSSFMSRVGGDDTALEIYELLSKVEVRWQLRRRMVRAARANGSGTGQTRHVLLVAVDEDSGTFSMCSFLYPFWTFSTNLQGAMLTFFFGLVY